MSLLPRVRRLYLKLYLAFLGMLLAAVGLFAAVHFLVGRGAFEVWRAGPRMVHHLARALPPPGAPPPELQRALELASDQAGFDLAVVDERGEVIAQAGMPLHVPVRQLVERPPRFTWWLEPGLVAAPLGRREGPRFFLLARVPLPPGVRAVLPLRLSVFLVALLLLSAVLLYPLSRSITRPLERLTAAAEAFGRGELGARSGISAGDEVGRLARSFDEMAGRIEKARRAEKELLANVSHELRTPLARMKVGLELLGVDDDPAALRRIRGLGEEIDELDRLVGDVLTASRLDLESLPLRPVRLLAEEVLEKSRRRALALSEMPDVEVASPPDLSLVADEALLSRALDNLVENARKHAGESGPIQLEARREDGAVLLAVSDRGPGFEPDELPRVFDPFFRGQAARSRSTGYGLGLALARRVAEAHGGTIRAVNAEGGGARLELRLPA